MRFVISTQLTSVYRFTGFTCLQEEIFSPPCIHPKKPMKIYVQKRQSCDLLHGLSQACVVVHEARGRGLDGLYPGWNGFAVVTWK